MWIACPRLMEVLAEACTSIHNDTDLASKTAYAQEIGMWDGGKLFLQNLMQKILVSFTANRKAIMAKDIVSVCYVMVNIKHTIFQLSVNMFFIDSTWHSTMSRTTRLYIFLEMKNINQLGEHDLEYIL